MCPQKALSVYKGSLNQIKSEIVRIVAKDTCGTSGGCIIDRRALDLHCHNNILVSIFLNLNLKKRFRKNRHNYKR